MKKIAEANRREKRETELAKQRAIEQIEADKRARREKAAAEKAGASAISEVSTTKPQPVASTQPTRQYDECNLQVRFPDGTVSRQTFKAVDLFEKVMEWVRSIQSSYPFILIQNFPRKEFTESDNYKTLTSLGLFKRLIRSIKRSILRSSRSSSEWLAYGETISTFSKLII